MAIEVTPEPGTFLALYADAIETGLRPTTESLMNYGSPRFLSVSTKSILRQHIAAPVLTRLHLLASLSGLKEFENLNLIDWSELNRELDTGYSDQSYIDLSVLEIFALAEASRFYLKPHDGVIAVIDIAIAIYAASATSQVPPESSDTETLTAMLSTSVSKALDLDLKSLQEHMKNVRDAVPYMPLHLIGASDEPQAPSLYASRASDRAELPEVDALGLRPDAKALAELICLKDPGPPLAIGLFGDWGAGKSTFMAMIEDEAAKAAELEREAFEEDSQRAPLFVQNVVQVRFNAWHYSEANLWSSLAAHIFRSLFEQSHSQTLPDGRPRPSWLAPDAFRKLLKDLADQRAVETDAQDTAETAREAFAQAKTTEREAREHRDRLSKAAEGDPKAMLQLVTDVGDAQKIDQALVDLGHEPVFGNAAAIVEIGQSMRSAKGRTLALLDTMSTPLCFGVAVAVFFIAGAAGLIWWAGIEDRLHHLAGVATIAGTLAAKLTALPSVIKNTATITLAGDAIMTKAREAQATAAADLKTAEAELDAAEVALAQARRRREGLEALADADNPEAALNAFLDARLGDGAYRDQLGVVSKLHDDFNALSELIRQSERDWQDARDASIEDGQAVEAPTHLQRIVLYIDDLDRCSDETVVKVLEAVHLLLALPLFAVVVGVDSRWLEGALKRVYEDQLGESGSASPSDYMEKIFQLPYWLPKLDTTDTDNGSFAQLVDSLVPELEAEVLGGASPEDGDGDTGDGVNASGGDGDGGDGGDAGGGGDDTPPSGSGEIVWVEPERTAAEEREVIRQQVELTKDELDCIKALAPLIGKSPRAVKRFMNSYRFLKATGGSDQRESSIPDAYSSAMLSLAIDVGLNGRVLEITTRLLNALEMLFDADEETMSSAFNDALGYMLEMPSQTAGQAPNIVENILADFKEKDGSPFKPSGEELSQLGRLWGALHLLTDEAAIEGQPGVTPVFSNWADQVRRQTTSRLTFRRPY